MELDMRILAISDIHDNVEAVRRLRILESNRFDAIVSAGDFGSNSITEMMGILSTFNCPVLYVLGNWDWKVDYETRFTSNTHHLHMTPVRVGGLSFIGYSGCDAQWGRNPIAAAEQKKLLERHPSFVSNKTPWGQLNPALKLKKQQQNQLNSSFREDYLKTYRGIALANRNAVKDVLRLEGVTSKRTVVVSHDRIFRIGEFFEGLPMHLFGHRHGFKDTIHNGVRCINVSALDARQMIECPAVFSKPKSKLIPIAIFDYGTYTVIEITSWFEISATSHRIYPDHPEVFASGLGFFGRTDYETNPIGGVFIDPSITTRKGYWSFHPLPPIRPGDPPRVIR